MMSKYELATRETLIEKLTQAEAECDAYKDKLDRHKNYLEDLRSYYFHEKNAGKNNKYTDIVSAKFSILDQVWAILDN